MTAAIIFGLLVALMLTGMPISISLGLTVLTFLFTMTQVPIESVALEAVHRHREVRDHGDPVLHPRRQLPHPWRRRAADDQLRHRLRRPPARRSRHRRRHGVRPVRRGLRLQPGDGGRHRLDPAAGDGQGRLSEAVRRRCHHHVRRARHPHPAVDRHGHVRGRHQHLGRPTVHRRRHPRHRAGDDAGRRHLVSCLARTTIRACRGPASAPCCGPSRTASGACC